MQQSLQLRQKLNDPEYIAETLSALGDVYSATGEYDKALNSVMSALDVSRKANNVKGAAGESHRIGLILQYQGRLGARSARCKTLSRVIAPPTTAVWR